MNKRGRGRGRSGGIMEKSRRVAPMYSVFQYLNISKTLFARNIPFCCGGSKILQVKWSGQGGII